MGSLSYILLLKKSILRHDDMLSVIHNYENTNRCFVLISLRFPLCLVVFFFERENLEVQLFYHMCAPCKLSTHQRQNLIKMCASAVLDLIRHSLTGSLEVEHLKLLIVKH